MRKPFLLALCALAPAASLGAAERKVPVMIGGREGAACPSVGRIIGLDPASVRSGPHRAGYREIDRRLNGQKVFVCGEQGLWFAVVYHPSGRAEEDCGVSRPWPRRAAYAGPCRSGWIEANAVDLDEG